jgi:chemotaxis protein MotA
MGAVMLQHPLNVFVTGIKMAGWVFFTPTIDTQKLSYQITAWGGVARRDGILALEAQLKNIEDPFVRKGLQMLVDGNSAEKIREVMDIDLQTYETVRWQAARVWESAAGYSPTIGILGAVLGLVHVMQSLAEPAKLGAGIAVAFIATIYGVGSANLVFLPIAGKLKILIARQVNMREMLIDGLCMVANAENPRFIENKLRGYIES